MMKLTEAAKKIGKVMGEYKEGKLNSSSGQKVKSRDQAIAIAMSEAGRSMPKRGSRTATNRGKK
jgi:Sec-independent protein translocase protein TatA